MKECSAFSKTICSICFEDLKPIVEDLQVISICGHVFHELCVQQWFEYCSKGQKLTCPVCKQRCSQEKAHRLYFQSIGDTVLSQKPFGVETEDDPKELRREVKRLEGKLSGLASSFESQKNDLKELDEELCICKEKAKKEEALKEEALKQKALVQHILNSKSEELLRASSECSRLQEKNVALAKELAALKLVSDLNLGEEDVLKLASLGHEANSKETIDILKKSLVLRNKSYKELLTHCNLLGRGESRYIKKLEKAEAKVKKLKSRVQELEIALEQKDNEVLRSLKASNITTAKGFDVSDRKWNSSSFMSKCSAENLMEQPVELVENSNQTINLTNDPCHFQKIENSTVYKDLAANNFNKETKAIDYDQGRHSCVIEEDVFELDTALHEKSSPDLKPQMTSCFSGSGKSSLSSPSSACDTKTEVWRHGQSSWVGLSTSSNGTKNDMGSASASVMKDDVVLFSDDIKELPLLNIKKEMPCPTSISHPGDQCFSGGLLGPDGTSRYLGKWCKRVQSKEAVSTSVMQGSDVSVGNLITVGADGRGGRVKVLRSQRESSLDSKESKLWTKRPKCVAKLRGQQSQGYLQIEHFFAKSDTMGTTCLVHKISILIEEGSNLQGRLIPNGNLLSDVPQLGELKISMAFTGHHFTLFHQITDLQGALECGTAPQYGAHLIAAFLWCRLPTPYHVL